MFVTHRPAIRHIVFFSAREKADVPRIVAGLRLLQDIPQAQSLEVHENTKSDSWSTDVDVVVYAEFASQDDLAAYRAHPLYQRAIEIVRPLRDMRIAADF